MRRKAQISGYTDIQWAGLIIIILCIFLLIVYATGGQTANQTIKPMNWEASWLATSYAQQPLNETTLLQALQDPINDEAVDERLQELLEQTTSSKNQITFAFATRQGSVVSCYSKQLRTTTPINNCENAATGSQTQAAPGVYGEYSTPNQAREIAKEELTSNQLDIQALRELQGPLGVGLVAGLQDTYVGVIAG